MPEKEILRKTIEEALRNPRAAGALQPLLHEMHPSDIAEVVLALDSDSIVAVFKMLPDDLAGVILTEAAEPVREDLLEDLSEEKIADIIDTMAPDIAVDVMELLEPEEEKEVLNEVEAATAEDIKELRAYDSESAGGIMTTRYFAVADDATIGDALAMARIFPEDESISCVFVVDREGRLVGVLTLRHLLRSMPSTPVKDLMETDVVSVKVSDDREDVAYAIQKYDFTVVPVVDENNVLKGMVTFDDAMDTLEEEASEDMYRMAGTIARYPTMETVTHRVLKRLPFLMITLAGGFASAMILSNFQGNLAKVGALVLFIPIMAATAGSVGIQSATVIVRGLALGDITVKRIGRTLFNELRVGFLVAIVCGLLAGIISSLVAGDGSVGLVVLLSMVAGVTTAAITSTLVPLLCEKIHVDPAIAAGPFVTTMNDISGVTIYMTVAALLLPTLR